MSNALPLQENQTLQLLLRAYAGISRAHEILNKLSGGEWTADEFTRTHRHQLLYPRDFFIAANKRPREEIVAAFHALGSEPVATILYTLAGDHDLTRMDNIRAAVRKFVVPAKSWEDIDAEIYDPQLRQIDNQLHLLVALPISQNNHDVLCRRQIDLDKLSNVADCNVFGDALGVLHFNRQACDFTAALKKMISIADSFEAGDIQTKEQEARAAAMMAIAVCVLPHHRKESCALWQFGNSKRALDTVQDVIDEFVEEGDRASALQLAKFRDRLCGLEVKSPIFADPEKHAFRLFAELEREKIAALWDDRFQPAARPAPARSQSGFARRF